MNKYQKFDRFPLGSIKAEGFLKEQMLRGKDGICGHLHELEPNMIADPYINKSHVSAWEATIQNGWGAEISGNYWTGYIQFAYTLDDPEMKKVASEWVYKMMQKQRADGYLGTYCEPDADVYEDFNAWGTAGAMRGLIAYYEATGKEEVLDAVYRCLLWFCDVWAGDKKTTYAGPLIIEPMIFVYNYKKDERLIKFCEEYLEFVCKNAVFDISYKDMLYGDYRYNSAHTAGYGVHTRLPALVYTVDGNRDYLNSSARALDMMHEKSVQITGSPVSDNEYLSPVSAVSETEYCCYAFYNATYSYMSYITGEAKYGDRMEIMFYNGAQGARKKDEKAIAYMNSPNQVYATVKSSRTNHDSQAYAPCYPTSCCPVNAVVVVPEFIRGMLLRDSDDNVCVMAYGPCSLDYNDVKLRVNTYYPFRNTVTVNMECDKEFTLSLRVPSFAKAFELSINGEVVKAEANGGFIAVRRAWKKADEITVSFKAEIETIVLNDNDYCKNYPIGIKYGALVFAYHIPEIWKVTEGRPMTKLPEGWHWYNLVPNFVDANAKDRHDRLALRRNGISWNIAVDENLSAKDFVIEELPENGYVWENPMIKLHTHAYKAPYMFPPYPTTTYEPYGEYQSVTEKIPLTLEPFGCTNLRIAYFPKAKL